MKHFFLLLAGVLFSVAARAGTETTTRRYDVSQLELMAETAPNGKTFTRIHWDGLELTSTPGAPELPVEYIRFIVPTFVKVTGVKVLNKYTQAEKLDYSVYPAQEPVLTNHEGPVEFTTPDQQAYNTTYAIHAEYMEDGFIDGCNHIVTVAVYPFSYNPVEETYSRVSSLTVMLDYEECGMSELNATPIFPPHQSKYLDLLSMVENPDRLASPAYVPRRKATADTPEYYYIITPRELAPAFEDLAVWKRQKDYNVVVKCIEDVYEDEDFKIGSRFRLNADATEEEVLDSAMSLRCYLKREFQNHGHFFCLLAGDWRTPMPMRKRGSPFFSSINSQNLKPTDNYYRDLSSIWELQYNLNFKIYVNYRYPNSYSNTISVGRLLCASKPEVDNYVKKLFIYEANPGYGDNSYLGNAVFLSSVGFQ